VKTISRTQSGQVQDKSSSSGISIQLTKPVRSPTVTSSTDLQSRSISTRQTPVGAWEGDSLGEALGWSLGEALGGELGFELGSEVGAWDGDSLGEMLGWLLGWLLGESLGRELGVEVGVMLKLSIEFASILGQKISSSS
jgi:outer membrane lipoprotein SlyB